LLFPGLIRKIRLRFWQAAPAPRKIKHHEINDRDSSTQFSSMFALARGSECASPSRSFSALIFVVVLLIVLVVLVVVNASATPPVSQTSSIQPTIHFGNSLLAIRFRKGWFHSV
jgi:hypothetical protein